MDNVNIHKVDGAEETIKSAGATVKFLPPYSPDLDPIEQVFSKLKAILRSAAKRTVSALWDAIGDAVKNFTPTECANYLRNSGYAST